MNPVLSCVSGTPWPFFNESLTELYYVCIYISGCRFRRGTHRSPLIRCYIWRSICSVEWIGRDPVCCDPLFKLAPLCCPGTRVWVASRTTNITGKSRMRSRSKFMYMRRFVLWWTQERRLGRIPHRFHRCLVDGEDLHCNKSRSVIFKMCCSFLAIAGFVRVDAV